MDRIKGKVTPSLPRQVREDETKPVELPRAPGQGLPSSSRLVAAGSSLSASQRDQNRQLVALYHAMRDIESGNLAAREATSEPTESKINGWKKRTPRKVPVKSRGGRANRQDGQDEEDGQDGEDGQDKRDESDQRGQDKQP